MIQNIWFKTKNTETQKTSFPKEILENADLNNSVFNKIMTTQKQCVKYDFVAQLNFYFSSSLLRRTPGSFTLIYFEH